MNPWSKDFENALISHVKGLLPPGTALTAATLYALQTPGKRIRPRLAAESAELVSLAPGPARLLQFAVELIHTFSLVHDDLPCMDNDDFRRGQPTVHKRFGEAQALLAGNLLFQLGTRALLEAAPYVAPEPYRRGVACVLDAVGAHGLIGGQSREFEKLARMTDDELISIQDRKTSALFRASILAPFHWAGVPETDPRFSEALAYANAFGFAFQIADDLDDAAQDAATGSKNILSIYGAEEAKRRARAALEASPIASRYSATTLLLQKLR